MWLHPGYFSQIYVVGLVVEEVAYVAVEDAADGVQGADTDGADLAGLEDGHVGQGDSHLVRELAQGHLALGEYTEIEFTYVFCSKDFIPKLPIDFGVPRCQSGLL